MTTVTMTNKTAKTIAIATPTFWVVESSLLAFFFSLFGWGDCVGWVSVVVVVVVVEDGEVAEVVDITASAERKLLVI